jgi:peptide/nickel transport system substrate-binding protein
MYDSLFLPSSDLQTLVPRLALSAEPNADASVWTLHLRDGVTWHDGKPFTADDVIHSFKLWTDPALAAAVPARFIDVSRVRKRGRLTVEVPLKQPIAAWPTFLCFAWATQIVQAGSTPKSLASRPIGTGPFKFVSGTSTTTTLAKNPDFWEPGKPYVERLVIDSGFTDDTTRANALLGGQIDVMPLSPFEITKSYINSSQVTAIGSPSPTPYGPFIMRVDKGAFADVRVRQAMKLIADRQALIDGAYDRFGTVGNDLLGAGLPFFASELRRAADIEQAKSLLKAAGRTNSAFTLETSNYAAGVAEAATLFAQQGQAAGVTIRIKQVSPAIYETPAGGYGSATYMRQDVYTPATASLAMTYAGYLSPGALYNESFWGAQAGGGAAGQLINRAMAEMDHGKAADLWHEVQLQQFNAGGYVVWGNADSLSLVARKVKGLTETQAGILGFGRLEGAWIT